MAKFNVGDKVVITKRAPDYIKQVTQAGRKRTIVATYYDKDSKCRAYKVGTNKSGKAGSIIESYRFRSYQLKDAANMGKAGRPKTKRKYTKRGL